MGVSGQRHLPAASLELKLFTNLEEAGWAPEAVWTGMEKVISLAHIEV
jgi:hypothetical protein